MKFAPVIMINWGVLSKNYTGPIFRASHREPTFLSRTYDSGSQYKKAIKE